MAHYNDWLPGKRDEQLKMAKNWLLHMKSRGKPLWKMDDEVIPDFEDALTLASDENSRPKSSRTAGTNVQLKEAFEKLISKMRYIKKYYFINPPLTNVDLVNLWLHPKDTNPTSVPAPQMQVSGELSCPGKGLVELKKIHPVGDQQDTRSDYGVRIYYGIMGESDDKDRFRISKPPRTGDDLPHSIFTRQKKHLFDFAGESGKQVFFCLRYENSKGQAGPWGNVLETFIS